MNTTVEPNNDRSDTPSLGEYKEKGDYISRKNERAIINEHAHTSISLRDNGQINITAGEYSQYKLNHSGMNTEYAIESGLIANRRNLSVDEIEGLYYKEKIPKIGRFILYVRTTKGFFISLGIIFAAIIILSVLEKIIFQIKKLFTKKDRNTTVM